VFDPAEIASWPKGSDAFVEAFAKGLAVLGAFGDGASDLSISEAAERTGLTRAGARRLLLTLVALGFAQERSGRFALTPRVLRLGFAYLSSLNLREVAQPLIEELAKESGEMVALSVLDGHETVYVARGAAGRVLARHVTVGSRMPAYCTSMGRALLSGLPDDELETYLATAAFAPLTRYTKTEPSQIREEVERARRQGWALAVQEIEVGVCGLAAPIRGPGGDVLAAVNMSTTLSRRTARQFATQHLASVLEVVARIEARLGPETPR
jgi:IclR family pca regulon transcriptional regulator